MAAGEFLAIFSASAWAASREPLGRVDDLADDAELVGPLGGDPLVAADERHAHDRLHRRLPRERDRLVRRDLADRHVRVEERRVVDAAITMSASATKCRPPPRTCR